MKLYLKQRIFSWFDSYHIYDKNNKIVFEVKGEFALGHFVKIYDKSGIEVGAISQKMLTWFPKFILTDGEANEIGMICRNFSWFKPKYTLTCNDWVIEGDIWAWNYKVVDSQNKVIFTASKKFNITDQYEIDIKDDKNVLLALMIVLAIDLDKCDPNN